MRPRAAPLIGQVGRVVPLAALSALGAVAVIVLAAAIFEPVGPVGESAASEVWNQDQPILAMAESPPFAPDALVAKPLFSPTRTPPEPPPAPVAEAPVAFVPPPAPEDPPPNYIVRGIMATPLTRKVLLRKEDQSKPIWLAEGEQSPEGWMLLRVSPEQIVLSKGSREISVHLKAKRAQKSQFAIR